MARRFYRWRVRSGFWVGAIALAVAQPTQLSLAVGASGILLGQALRLWAAGHIDKGRTLATGGPYSHLQHPLYLGSLVISLGMAIASASPVVMIGAAIYAVAFFPQAHAEERPFLAGTFGNEYQKWSAEVPAFLPRLVPAGPRATRFSWTRVARNREWQACLGVIAVILLLYVKPSHEARELLWAEVRTAGARIEAMVSAVLGHEGSDPEGRQLGGSSCEQFDQRPPGRASSLAAAAPMRRHPPEERLIRPQSAAERRYIDRYIATDRC